MKTQIRKSRTFDDIEMYNAWDVVDQLSLKYTLHEREEAFITELFSLAKGKRKNKEIYFTGEFIKALMRKYRLTTDTKMTSKLDSVFLMTGE